MVHTGRKQHGYTRALAKRVHAPAIRFVPWDGSFTPCAPHGTTVPAKMSKHDREMVDAWDNTGGTGNTVKYNRYTRMTELRMMARRSGMHVHDGPARHNIGPLKGSTVHESVSASAREFVRQLHIERNAR